MISLRSLTTVATAALASFALAACSDSPADPLTKGLQPSSASFDGKVGSTGNSAKNGDIDVRVLLDKSGNALLVIRTGTYNPTTNVAVPNGYFQSIQYKIYDAAGKQVQVKNVKFKQTGISTYAAYVDLCNKKDDVADDDDSGTPPTCATKYTTDMSVSVQANLKAVSGDEKKTDVVREDGADGYLPDVDLSAQKLFVVGANGAQTPAGAVPALAPVTYSVAFPNDKPINGVANTIGVMTTCLVYVDNVLQFAVPNTQLPSTNAWTNPNQFSYVGGASQPIPAGTVSACQFSLALSGGTHTIAVSALVTAPGDYDTTNNTTAKFNVTAASGPPDVAVYGNLQRLSGTTYSPLGALVLASGESSITTTVYQAVVQSGLTVPGSVACKFAVDGTELPTQSPVAPALNGVASQGYCSQPITLTAGSHKVKVTSISTPADGNAVNDTITTIVLVSNTPLTVSLSPTLSLLNGGTKTSIVPGPGAVLSGTTNKYAADIVATVGGTNSAVPVTCTVLVDNMTLTAGTPASVTGGTALLTWDNGPSLQLANNATGTCAFSLKLTENGTTDATHSIKVVATSNATTPASSASVTGSVTDQVRVDIAGVGVQRRTGGALVALDSTALNRVDTLVATFHNNDALKSTSFNCSVLFNDGAVPTGVLTLISTGPTTIAANSDATCSWSYKATTLVSITWTATATPAAGSPPDNDLTNNSAIGSVTVKSGGKFTDISATSASIQQEWFSSAKSATSIDTVYTQQATVDQLALIVIPNDESGFLGSFTVTGAITSNGVNFGTGTFAIPNMPMNSCVDSPAPYTMPNGGNPAGAPDTSIVYSARVCARSTTFNGQDGYQRIVVTYNSSLKNGIFGYAPTMYQQNVTFRIGLDFTLRNALPDHVSGTIVLPVPAPRSDASGFLWNTDASVNKPVVTTP